MKRVTFVFLGLITMAVFAFNSAPKFKNDVVKADQIKVKQKYVNQLYNKN